MNISIVKLRIGHTKAIATICTRGKHIRHSLYEASGFSFQEKRITMTETEEKQVSLRYARQLRLKPRTKAQASD